MTIDGMGLNQRLQRTTEHSRDWMSKREHEMSRRRRVNAFSDLANIDVDVVKPGSLWKVVEAENDHYTYTVTWSPPDEEFLATVADFPSLSWLASSRDVALFRLVALVRDTLVAMPERGETPPTALADRTVTPLCSDGLLD